ncbi:MAG: hypothetical protein LBL17_01800 [Coxiellaceae bacterium]|jgi:surfactin synthase thioesterase subunit|nr:hypothetical protein [Coxiellaceae bacterium]
MEENVTQNQLFLFQGKSFFSKLNLICFHHAGGAASFFSGWQKDLPNLIQLISFQLPGREALHNHLFLNDFNEVIDKIISNKLIFTSKPYALFGHSLGAIIAFELARRLTTDAFPQPQCLIVSGNCAPNLYKQEKFSHLSDNLFIKKMNEKYGGISDEILYCQELLNFLLPRFRADFYLSENYSYSSSPALKIPIFVFTGINDVSVDRGEIFAWEQETNNECKIYEFEGDHFFISSARKQVLERINKILYKYL